MGYLSNPTDEKLLRSKAHQKRIAKAILVGINAYIKQRLAFNR
jgi:N-acetylmuramoyl-L-alanine amidase